MKKLLITGGAVTGAAFVAKRLAIGIPVERGRLRAARRADAGGRFAQVDITSARSERTRTASCNCSKSRIGPRPSDRPHLAS